MPELNLLGSDTVAPPGLRHRYGLTFRILLGQLGHIRFQLLPAGGPALMGNGGAELAAPGAAGEVVAGLLGGDFLGAAVDDQLAVEGAPEHDEGDVGVSGDVVAFAAVVVGEEDEAAVFDAFEQHHAAGGAAVGGDGGQGHGVGQRQLGVDGVVDPLAGLFHRVRQQVRFGEAGGVVFLAYVFHEVSAPRRDGAYCTEKGPWVREADPGLSGFALLYPTYGRADGRITLESRHVF